MRLRVVTYILVSAALVACHAPPISPTKVNETATRQPFEIRSPGVSETYQEQARKYHSMENQIRLASTELGIENLGDSVHDEQYEIRIWVGFGLTYPRCLILRHQNGQPKAEYRTITTIRGPKEVREKVEPGIIKSALGIPKSGWDVFEDFLKNQGLDCPLQLGKETDYTPDPDGQIIAIEVRCAAGYGLVFFHRDNQSVDAQKVLGVCRRIEDEFSIALHCSKL